LKFSISLILVYSLNCTKRCNTNILYGIGEDQVKTYNNIKGFTGKTQTEIIKRSGGISKVPGLVEQAMQGEFNISMCHYGFYGFMPSKFKEKVTELLNRS